MEIQLKNKVPVNSLTGIYKSVFPAVARIVRSYGGGEEDAKDVFHDALLIWLEKPAEERAKIMNQTAYLVTIARNEWFQRVEKAGRTLEARFFIEEEEVRVSNDLYNFLAMAGRKCLDLLQSFYYEKRPAGEIARRFGFSGGHSASAQKYKCLEKLRELVKNNNIRKEDFYEN